MANFQRPNSAATKYSWQNVFKGEDRTTKSIRAAAPAAAGSLPLVATVAQEYVTPITEEDIICGGTWEKIGSIWGCLKEDTVAGETGTYVVQADKILCLLDSGATVTQGAPCYMQTADAELSDSATGADLVGYFRESAARTNPNGLPAGDYALIQLIQPGA